MTTFYRDSAVYVGSDGFQVGEQAYRLSDLELVWHRRGPRGAPGVALIAGRFLLIFAILGGIAAAGLAMRDLDLSSYSSGRFRGRSILRECHAGRRDYRECDKRETP